MTQTCSTSLDEQQRTCLLDFSEHLGIAFQIRDDILDEIADTNTLGKPQGSDREQNKPTYVSILGLEESERRCNQFHDDALKCLDDLNLSSVALRSLAQHIVCRQN